MGEYLKIFNDIKLDIYTNQIVEAKNKLKGLLNRINAEFISLPEGKDKRDRRAALNKLLPVLKELASGEVGSYTINALRLDPSRLIRKAPERPVENPTPESPRGGVEKESPKEAPKPAKRPAVKRPKNEFMPLYLDDYIGQEKAKESLRISIGAAKKENRCLGHLLICSPYGLGKTTLANIIANEMGMPFFTINATNLKDSKSLSNYFSKITDSCIIFIDEIHSLKKEIQTILLSILTDFQVNLINDAGEEERFDLPAFTLIGATTQAGELLKPFLNRFQVLELQDYTEDEKKVIVKSKFEKIGYKICDECILDVARRSRGVPRTIEIFTKGIRDIALNRNTKEITKDITDKFFSMNEIDECGLNKNDRQLLRALDEAERPLALITLESKTGIQREDLEFRYEPYLIKLGLMEKTEKGRVITKKGRIYLHGEEPSDTPVAPELPEAPELPVEPLAPVEDNNEEATPSSSQELNEEAKTLSSEENEIEAAEDSASILSEIADILNSDDDTEEPEPIE